MAIQESPKLGQARCLLNFIENKSCGHFVGDMDPEWDKNGEAATTVND